ncbi:hypothetical protein V6N12_050398 [Hibiscus sabdariffa]|uniref:Uncharacterized protein n=1 Tax=Hibiscus sabdariffa TaxID=183260 RepID=A0ABR2GCQ7_9ROSI
MGDKTPTDPTTATTSEIIVSVEDDDIDPEDPDDTVVAEPRVDHETNRDASATDVATALKSDSLAKKGSKTSDFPHHSHKG